MLCLDIYLCIADNICIYPTIHNIPGRAKFISYLILNMLPDL